MFWESDDTWVIYVCNNCGLQFESHYSDDEDFAKVWNNRPIEKELKKQKALLNKTTKTLSLLLDYFSDINMDQVTYYYYIEAKEIVEKWEKQINNKRRLYDTC